MLACYRLEMRAAFCVVAGLALGLLLIRAARVGLAGDYVDPITKIRAQDEALYAHSAIRMSQQGGWMTPTFLGRYALYKPPLLVWAAGVSARVLGVSRFSLRLPVALACSLALGLIFLWAAELRSWEAGVAAALLAGANHLWLVLGAMTLTDGLLAAFCTAAVYCLYSDPWLKSRSWLAGFAASVAAAILTKSVAGLLPLAVLGVYWLAAPRHRRPAFARVCLTGLLSLALAAPWFAYQMQVHGRWFRAEHINVEILGFGSGAPPQTSQENQVLFYLGRLAAIDPTLAALAILAMPALARALRRRDADAVLLAVWAGLSLLVTFGWRYRNAAYLLPAVPALAILAAAYSPLAQGARRRWLPLVAGLALVLKLAVPGAAWGASLVRGTVQTQAGALADYCRLERGNELILYGFDDDLYGATLPLPRVRYALISPGAVIDGPYGMPFGQMGITMEARQFNDLARWEPVYRERLREWGLDSSEPIGSLILARSAGELDEVIRNHPGSDFFLPEYLDPAGTAARETHDMKDVGNHFFLLARRKEGRAAPARWPCGM